MSSRTSVVQAENVRKSFADFEAVRGASFDIRPGECFGLLGPNGAGKSTFINMIYGVTRRTSGDLRVFGMDPNSEARAIKRRLGVVTQENALDESLSVRENMEIYGAFVELSRDQRDRRVSELLEFMSLAHKQNDPIRTLSGGMKRRLVFVRALLADPELVILDEPTTGLDPAVRHLLWGKVNQLKAQGKTVVLTTHYMHEAEVLCNRLVIMNQGQVIAEGSPQALRERYSPGFVAAFESSDAAGVKSEALQAGHEISEDSSGIYVRAPLLTDLIEFQKRLGLNAQQMRPSNLEDVFLQLTGQELTADA
ncbi:MAG: ABC transporter ATP-binding protein [Bdellovibrionales bacterium]|nr:ABC transporter ATP-binding protein [Bdellovibrionales bacterium]